MSGEEPEKQLMLHLSLCPALLRRVATALSGKHSGEAVLYYTFRIAPLRTNNPPAACTGKHLKEHKPRFLDLRLACLQTW